MEQENKPTVGKEAIDMTAQEWFEKGSMFTLDFLLPEEQETIYKIMDLFAQGKVRFHAASLLKERDELKERVINLQQADMTHEYNNAEAERVWPQIKQQIIDEAVESKEKECAELKKILVELINWAKPESIGKWNFEAVIERAELKLKNQIK